MTHGRGQAPERLSQAVTDLIALRGWAQVQGHARLDEAWKDGRRRLGRRGDQVLGIRRSVLQVAVGNSPLLERVGGLSQSVVVGRPGAGMSGAESSRPEICSQGKSARGLDDSPDRVPWFAAEHVRDSIVGIARHNRGNIDLRSKQNDPTPSRRSPEELGTTHNDPGYDARDIRVLEGIEGIRKRPAMYIGDTTARGLHHLVYEVVDNSIDEAVNGFATVIIVRINADGSVTITDDGRGIPVGAMPDMENRSALEVVLTEIHAGGKFDRTSGYKTGTGGLHGIGITAVNALSEWLEAEVRREGHVWTMDFARGAMTSGLKQLGKSERTGTKITFRPDPQIFPDTEVQLRHPAQAAAGAGISYARSDESSSPTNAPASRTSSSTTTASSSSSNT